MRPESDFQDGVRWRGRAEPQHPALVGLLLLLVAAVAGVLLLRYLGQPGGDGREPTEVGVAAAPGSAEPPDARPDARPNAQPPRAALKISPFRRSHPWAAPSSGRYYYRSSCPEALSLEDLRFFRTEREARAAGLKHSPAPGC
jgi:hypothetical protein